MDWKTLLVAGIPASITAAGSILVLVRTQSIQASLRTADRQHERELAYEQRVWELKNAALTTLIYACAELLRDAQFSGSSMGPRAKVVIAMEQFRDRMRGKDGVLGQLLAYAADPVRRAIDHLLDTIEAERNLHSLELVLLYRLEPDLAALRQELRPEPSGPMTSDIDVVQRYNAVNSSIARMKNQIENRSKLDIEKVIAQCNQVINAVRDDLRAKPVESPQPQRVSWWRRGLAPATI